MKILFYSVVIFLFWLLTPGLVWSDQPVFNEMPRWDHGWGFQLVEEYRRETDLMSGDRVVAEGFSESVHILNVEGVYTFDKSFRITAKLPIVLDAKRELPDGFGGQIIQRDHGLGDLTIAVPLKHYFNLDGRSGSWTMAPQVRVPLSGDGDYEVYDGVWGSGLSLGYETETYDYLFGVGFSNWVFEGDEPYQFSAHVDLGLNFKIFNTSGNIKWETDFTFEDDGTEKLYIGPQLYLRVTDTVHAQFIYRQEVHARRNNLDHGNGEIFKLGLGFVF